MNRKFARLIFIIAFAVCTVLCLFSCENPLLEIATGLYTVKFETNCDTAITSYRARTVENIPSLQKEDAAFMGWYTNASFTGNPISLPFELTKDTTLYARWNQKYTVAFETNGGTEIVSYKTSVISEKPLATKSACEFMGWYATSDFSGEAIEFPCVITESLVLYAKWNKIYTVSFVTNGGTAISQYQCTTITNSPSTKRTGYKFLAWYLDKDFSTPVTFPYMLDGDTTLYAKWTESTETAYTVEHYKQNTDLASYTLSETVEMEGATQTTTEATKKIYMGFTAKDFEQIAIAADGSTVVKIYYDRNAYTVSFDANGGSGEMDSQTFYYGVEQKLATNRFTRIGCSFIGWSQSKNADAKYADGNAVQDLTLIKDATLQLYAQWFFGINVTAATVQQVELSNLTEDSYTIKVTGNITNYTLQMLAEKIQSSSVDIHLDLSEATGLIALSSTNEPADSYTNAKKSIFADCKKLKSISLPQTLETIGSYAFYECSSITSVTIPQSVKTIGAYAFAYCSKLKTVSIDGLETIGSFAFYHCTDLESVILKNISTVGSDAFYSCTNMQTAVLANVEKLNAYAFGTCTSLSYLKMNNITSISYCTFYDCTSLTSVTIDAVAIENCAFKGCKTLTAVTIGKNVTKIDNTSSNSVFKDCDMLTSVTFLDTQNWYYKMNSYSYSLDVTNASTNASNLTGWRGGYEWYKK